MSARTLQPGVPGVWGVPLANGLACVWTVTPGAYRRVEIDIESVSTRTLLRRRLISKGRRLSLFVVQSDELQGAEPCRVSFQPEAGAPAMQAVRPLRLADWSAPLMANVVQAVAGLAGTPPFDERGAPLFVRYLSLASAWRVPCLFSGRIGGLFVAAFDFAPSAAPATSRTFMSDGRNLSVAQSRWIVLESGACFVWRDEGVRSLYVANPDGLVELIPESSEHDADAWLSRLEHHDLQVFLDACSHDWTAAEAAALGALRRLSDPPPPVGSADAPWSVLCAFPLNDRLYVTVEGSGQRHADPPELSVRFADGADVDVDLFRESSGTDRHRHLLIYRSDAAPSVEPTGLLRVAIDGNGDRATWVALSSAHRRGIRAILRDAVLRGRADGALIDELYVPVALGQQPGPTGVSGIDLVARRRPVASSDPLLVCHVTADLAPLQLSLSAIALTLHDVGPTLRLVVSGAMEAGLVAALRAECLRFGLAAEAIFVERGEPIAIGLAPQPDDAAFQGTVILRAGAVPRRATWWSDIAGRLRDRPDHVWCHPAWGSSPVGDLAVDDALGAAASVVAAGRDAREAMQKPHEGLLTFSAYVADAVERARETGTLSFASDLDFHPPPAVSDRIDLHAVRLDTAVLKSLHPGQGMLSVVSSPAPSRRAAR